MPAVTCTEGHDDHMHYISVFQLAACHGLMDIGVCLRPLTAVMQSHVSERSNSALQLAVHREQSGLSNTHHWLHNTNRLVNT